MQTNFETLKGLLFLNDDLSEDGTNGRYFIDGLTVEQDENGYLIFELGQESSFATDRKTSAFRTNANLELKLGDNVGLKAQELTAKFICDNFTENEVLQIIEEIKEFIETHAKQDYERAKFVSLVREFFPLTIILVTDDDEENSPLEVFSEDTDKIPYPFFEENENSILTFVVPHYEKEGNVTVKISQNGETTFSLYGAWDKLPLYENFISYYEIKLLERGKGDVKKMLSNVEMRILLHACKEYAAKYLPELR